MSSSLARAAKLLAQSVLAGTRNGGPGCLGVVWVVSEGVSGSVCWVSEVCLRGCLGGLSLGGVWRVSGGGLGGVWEVSEWCLGGVKGCLERV